MRFIVFACVLVLVGPAGAEPERPKRIALPHAGFSFEPAAGWSFTQFDGAVITLRKSKAQLRVLYGADDLQAAERVAGFARRLRDENGTVSEEPWRVSGVTSAARCWLDTPKARRFLGVLSRLDGTSLEFEAILHKGQATLADEIRAMCDSVNANAFAHPRRLVHWSAGWTLDAMEGWKADVVAGVVRLRSEGADHPVVYIGPKDVKGPSLAQYGEPVAIPHRVGRPADPANPTLHEQRYLFRPRQAGDPTMQLIKRTAGNIAVWLVAEHEARIDDVLRMVRTLRPVTDPGAQKDDKPAPTTFSRADGPPVTFELPTGWSLQKPTSRMRLAQFQIPGDPALVGVAYWFGAGRGGTVEMNLERWRGQMEVEGDPAEPVVETPAEGVRITTLDLTGTFVAAVRPGAKERVNKPRSRMFASVLEVAQGPIFVKLVGDAEAMGRVKDAYDAWVRSFRAK